MGRTPLSGHELDDLKNWALGAREDDPSDDFPPLLLRLLEENAELRELLYRAEDGGELKVLSDVNNKLDAEQARNRTLTETNLTLHNRVREANQENAELKHKLELSRAIMHKVEVLMQLARERMATGEGTTLEAVARLMEDAQEKVKPVVGRETHERIEVEAERDG